MREFKRVPISRGPRAVERGFRPGMAKESSVDRVDAGEVIGGFRGASTRSALGLVLGMVGISGALATSAVGQPPGPSLPPPRALSAILDDGGAAGGPVGEEDSAAGAASEAGADLERAGFHDRLAELERELASIRAAEEKSARTSARFPSVKWTGQFQLDGYAFEQSPLSRARLGDAQDGAAFRRARLGAYGDYEDLSYRIEFEFAFPVKPTFLDVWVGLNEVPLLGRLRAGHYFEPFGLERVTPNRFTTFLERSIPDQAFSPSRNIGVMFDNHTEDLRWTWAAGAFRGGADEFGSDVGDDASWSWTGRVTHLVWDEDGGRSLFHLGAAYSLRGPNAAGSARFRTQPEARLGAATPNVPFMADTGELAVNRFQLIGLEAALVEGPLSIQGEAYLVPVALADNAAAGPDPFFWGAHVFASWFLTGEHRPYKREYGFFDRVRPLTHFRPGGWRFAVADEERPPDGPGAWEVAARLSAIDLNGGDIRGGRLVDASIGLNWYWNPYTRVQFNYIRALRTAPGEADLDMDIFGVRIGFDF